MFIYFDGYAIELPRTKLLDAKYIYSRICSVYNNVRFCNGGSRLIYGLHIFSGILSAVSVYIAGQLHIRSRFSIVYTKFVLHCV